jgi:hypothetical protein
MERQSGGNIILDLRDPISKARRFPATCLYCAQVPNSEEHALPQALGGRLGAKILCLQHNTLVGNKCDDPMIEQLSPIMFMLGTPRIRGAKYASLRGKSDSGESLVVRQNWKVDRRRIEEIRKATSGKIDYVKGETLQSEHSGKQWLRRDISMQLDQSRIRRALHDRAAPSRWLGLRGALGCYVERCHLYDQ